MTTRRHKPVFNESVKASVLVETIKSVEHEKLIYSALKNISLTKDLPNAQHEQLCKIVELQEFEKDAVLIKEGDNGDRFYIIVSGHCDVFKAGKQVNECKPGQGFGDLALLYNQPRAATIIATEKSIVYYLKAEHFKSFLMQAKLKQIEHFQQFLKEVKILKQLNDQEIYMLAQAMRPYSAIKGTHIIEQGENGDVFYFIEKGDVEIVVNGKKVAELHAGSYFGEQALLHDTPRNATVITKDVVDCMITDRDTFKNLIGNIGDALENGRKNQ